MVAPTAIPFGHGDRWFAVHCQPFCELRAQANLQNQDFRTFMPKRHKTVRHARKLRTVESPFFPRYMFVVLDLGRDRWRSVNSTFGVSRLVMRGELPEPVPRGVVETLIASADEGGILHLADKLKIGSPVRMLAGPFADQLAMLEHLDDLGRVRVLVDLLGRKVSISTGARDLLPIS
ncbi:MAG TPA: transcriptional activator RfaH [Stellaceae bacterium]|nr:transcriptional activator RfaH [Stellaceae bacterium]